MEEATVIIDQKTKDGGRRARGKSIFTVFSSTACYLLLAVCLFFIAPTGQAATLSVSPATGTFTVNSTFEVPVYLNTQGQAINALRVSMSFSPDKLQLISPSAGKSIIGIWTDAPKFNNQTGRITLEGGIPSGINVSQGLITTLQFRVKSVGSSTLRFTDETRVLLNDGKGTDALTNATNGIYQFVLPPPQGPLVVSETHPNQSVWYPDPNVSLRWDSEGDSVEGYSYILNKEAVDVPDNISEGQKSSVTYTNLGGGVYYFHIKSLRNGAWGGVTHFAFQIDASPPAQFSIDVIPSARTTRKQPVVQFESSDNLSGLDHYEIKLIPLKLENQPTGSNGAQQPLFTEAQSPHILPPLDFGTYDIIVRAYDKAGNFQEITQHLSIVHFAFEFFGPDGLAIRNVIVLPWAGLLVMLLLLVLLLWFAARRIRKLHHAVSHRNERKVLPDNVQKDLEELKKYRSRYGPTALLLLLVIGASLYLAPVALAQQNELSPPLISTFSRSISNEEIFYAGGKTDAAQVQVILYLQNLQDGQTISETITADNNGDWFYRHGGFLSSGDYLIWAQAKIGEQLSPPSPQVQMTVQPTALQFGSSRLSYEILYFALFVLLMVVAIVLAAYIMFHGYHARRKHQRFVKEMKEAQESVRRGFAVLRRDIQAEFATIKKAKLSKELTQEERIREEQLVKDLQEVERYIGKEIWDIEENEYSR